MASRNVTTPPRHEGATGVCSQPSAAIPPPTRRKETSTTLEDPRIWTSNASDQSGSPSEDPLGVLSHSASWAGSVPPGSSAVNLPDYIKPFPSNMDPEDIQYLQMRGALTLPDLDLRDACLMCYFRHIQPIYPIVDPTEIAFLLNETNPKNEKLSLLLLYALIFVGSTWVNVRLIRKLGFLSRIAFRRSIHRKMRLLYDADYENDRRCLIQTFLLWTFWFEGPNENKDGWHWIGVALSLSRVIGLHRASDPNTDSTVNRRDRRLWWSLATRDVICSFALSRSPRIAHTDHNMTMLEIEDFEFHQTSNLTHEAVRQPLHHQRTFAQICVLYVQLINIFGKICKAAYPESGSGKTSLLYSSQQLEGTDSMNSNANLSIIDQLKSLEKDLNKWRQGIPDHLWHNSNLPSDPDDLERAELVHRGLLSMMYYATLMILHRPQMLPAGTVINPAEASKEATPDPSRAMVRFAARQITQIAMDFYEEDLVQSLSATCITCLILASITLIFDMISDDQAIRSQARQKLEQCKAIFRGFSEHQVGGQWALHVIEYILDRVRRRERDCKVDLAVPDKARKPAAASIIHEDGDVPSAGNFDHPIHVETSQSPVSAAPSGQRSTNVLVSDGSTFASMIPNMPTFSEPRLALSGTDALWPSLAFDQRPPDNLASFLEPDLTCFDFLNASEAMDGISWAEAGPI